MNTAKKFEELEHYQEIKTMLETDRAAFARTVWDSPQKAISLYNFWKQLSQGFEGDAKIIAELELRRIEAIMIKMTDINSGFYQSRAESYIDARASNVTTDTKDTSKVEDLLPEVESGGKKVSLFAGEEMGDKPEHQKISSVAKRLISEGKVDDATALATQYFGTGNYLPKNEGQPVKPWNEKQINGWIKSLVKNLNESKEETKEQEIVRTDNSDIEDFGKEKSTLAEEIEAFHAFAKQFVELATAGSEDAEAAEELATLFFRDRDYNAKQVEKWKQEITGKEDELDSLDHFKILGPPGNVSGTLLENERSYEKIKSLVLKAMKETLVADPTLEKKDTLLQHMIDRMREKFHLSIIGTFVMNEEKTDSFEIYTGLHYNEFIKQIVVENFPSLTQEEDSNAEKATEGSSSKSPKSVNKKEEKLEEPTVKDITVTMVKNGGTIEDVIDEDNIRFKDFIGEDKLYKTREELNAYITEHFEEWETEYKNSEKYYPYSQFERSLEMAYKGDVSLEDFIKEAKEYLVKPNGSVLTLRRKKKDNDPELLVNFEKVSAFEDYIKTAYARLEKEDAEEEMQKSDSTEEQTEVVDTEVVESTENVETEEMLDFEPSSEHEVTIGHIENLCNRAIKKGHNMSYILKDHQIKTLIEEGGSIVNKDKTLKIGYDLSAEAIDKLNKDLTDLFDSIFEKRNKTKTDKKEAKTVVEQIKEKKETPKIEDAEIVEETEETKEVKTVETTNEVEESEETTLETDPSVITSFNQVGPAGLKLIEAGCTKKELLEWGLSTLLNRRMKEQAENSTFTSYSQVEKFMKGFFKDFFGEEAQPEAKETVQVTVETLGKKIQDQVKSNPDITYPKLVGFAKTFCEQNKLNIPNASQLELVRTKAKVIYEKYVSELEKKEKETVEEKVFVPEKVSENHEDLWNIVKEFTTLTQIYNQALELVAGGDWQKALNMTIELIKTGNIEEAVGWNEEQISDWFDKIVLKKEAPSKKKEESKSTETFEKEFLDIQQANGRKSFNESIINVLTKYSDTPELREKIIRAIRGGKANYARRMSKAKESDLHKKINGVKKISKLKDEADSEIKES